MTKKGTRFILGTGMDWFMFGPTRPACGHVYFINSFFYFSVGYTLDLLATFWARQVGEPLQAGSLLTLVALLKAELEFA